VDGIIGTWLAAGLALIAPFGILQVYYLYRRPRTKRYCAVRKLKT
jgi:hypothetical protein